jgi:hypothetical protein
MESTRKTASYNLEMQTKQMRIVSDGSHLPATIGQYVTGQIPVGHTI